MIRRAWHRATRTWREAAAIIADEQARAAQAPVPPPFASPSGGGAGPRPVPGQQAIPVPAHGRPPRPAPAPATRPRLLMSFRFYSDGVVYVDDHIKRKTTRFDPPPDNEDDWDAAFERLQAGDHPDGF